MDSLSDNVALSDVGSIVRREDVVSQENFHVNFGPLNRFKLIKKTIIVVTWKSTGHTYHKGGLVAVSAIKAHATRQL
jgi:hypothetical protein